MQRNAVVGAMKIIYWLAKEVAHTTKYESLLDLAIDLRCNYLKELHATGNATHQQVELGSTRILQL